MARLEYSVQQTDIIRWATLQAIQSYIDAQGIKRLSIAIDPLINKSVINPEESYEITTS